MKAQSVDAPQEFLAQLRELHKELGIPADYLQTSQLPLCITPDQLVSTDADFYQRPQQLTPQAHLAWLAMRDSAAEDGITLHLISAYRSVQYQRDLIARKLSNGENITEILKVIAAPGFSEHHTGRAIDLHTQGCEVLEESFEITPAFQWLTENSGKYGFRLSYPRNNAFGISYEPWHWCYQPQ